MSQQSRDDLPRTITSASRLSLGLFAVYVLLYAGFMTLGSTWRSPAGWG
jgi:hypothetical protein